MLSDCGQIGLCGPELGVPIPLRNTVLGSNENKVKRKNRKTPKLYPMPEKLLEVDCLPHDFASCWPFSGHKMAASLSDLHVVSAFPTQHSSSNCLGARLGQV